MIRIRRNSGFTIVELLIVIIVIAVLATITIVTYQGIQTRARASEASTGLSQAKKKLELYKVDNSAYPTTGNLSLAGITNSDTTYQYTSTDGSSFCLTATSGNVSYYIDSTTHTSPTAGGCPGHGQGGVSAITNLASDPRVTALYTNTPSMPAGKLSLGHVNWCGNGDTCTKQIITGASDGPAGIQTYLRLIWTGIVNTPQAVGYRFTNDGTLAYPVTAGTTYTLSYFFRASKGWTVGNNTSSERYVISFFFYDSGGTQVGSTLSYQGLNQVTANTWVRPSATATAPAGAVYMKISGGDVYVPTSAGWLVGDTFDATGMMVTEGSTLYTYADGSSTNWTWNGTANASSSTGPPL